MHYSIINLKFANANILKTNIMTYNKAYHYVFNSLKNFNFVACPTFLYEGKNEADKKLIIDAYYDLHCQELGI